MCFIGFSQNLPSQVPSIFFWLKPIPFYLSWKIGLKPNILKRKTNLIENICELDFILTFTKLHIPFYIFLFYKKYLNNYIFLSGNTCPFCSNSLKQIFHFPIHRLNNPFKRILAFTFYVFLPLKIPSPPLAT